MMRRLWHKGRVCAAIFLAVALLASSCTKDKGKVEDGSRAPDFTLGSIQGDSISLSALRGKVVVVEFWATWCPPCRESIPDLNKIYEKFRGRNFELLAISVDKGGDAPSSLKAFVNEYGVMYPVLWDDKNVNSLYNVSGIPVMFIIDKEGYVVKKHTGFAPGLSEMLLKEVEALL